MSSYQLSYSVAGPLSYAAGRALFRGAGGLPSLVTDNFDRANGVLGANWSNLALTGYSNNLNVISNQTGMVVGANHAIACWTNNSFSNDQWCELTFPVPGLYGGLAVRCDPIANSAYSCFIFPSGGGTNYWFFLWLNGNPAAINTASVLSATPISPTDVVRFEVTGSTLAVKLNGATIGTLVDTTLTFGSPGINIYDLTARVDNFRAGPVTPLRTRSPGLYIGDFAKVLPPTGTLKIERTQAWSCLSNVAIVNPDTTAGSIIFTNVLNAPYTGYEIWIVPSGQVRVKIMHSNDAGQMIQVTGTKIVTDGNFHMIAATYDGSSTAAGVKIYVDGVLETTATDFDTLGALTIVTGAGDMMIGNQSPGANPFGLSGVMSFFAFSNIVRDQTYMTAHASRATAPTVDANNTLHYDFTEGAGTTLTDKSSNAYTGAISGTTAGTGYKWY